MSTTTINDLIIRDAVRRDVDQLLRLENQSFDSDKLSRRSFNYMIGKANALLLVAELEQQIIAYVLVLYSQGTSLGRIYSLAVSPDHKNKGLASKLMQAAEQHALQDGRSFLRLEVRPDNVAAIRLYEKLGYKQFEIKTDYYEDHADALRMMKVLHHQPENPHQNVAHYSQTTEFTCGPACLMMAMKTFQPQLTLDRSLELQLWREATTIFMTSGHGGCSAQGLALAANRRGLATTLITNSDEVPFINGVRSEEKKAVIECVHQDFVSQITYSSIQQVSSTIDVSLLHDYLQRGAVPLVLISSYRLNRSKSPHWVVVVSISDTFVYLHDPDVDWEENKSVTDSWFIPVTHREFNRMLGYGKPRYQAAVVINADKTKPRISH